MKQTRPDCAALDARPCPLAALAARFAPGTPGTLYFDANSIGPMPLAAPQRVQALLEGGWRVARRRGWSEADWLEQPRVLGAAVAPLIGAGADDVIVADSTSVNQFKLLQLALAARAPRRVMVVERGVFPSNRYVAQGIAQASAVRAAQAGLGGGSGGGSSTGSTASNSGNSNDSTTFELRDIAHIDELPAALAPGDVAVVALSHVDYRSSLRLDLQGLTALAHRHGALALWDLSHSAGAVVVDLRAADVDLALGCGYKYLCGGPGAPAWMYVHPRWQGSAWPAIAGWMGHAETFAFAPDFQPAAGMRRHLVGTPAVIANAAFGAAADIWREVDVAALDARHRSLGQTLIRLVDEQFDSAELSVISPREPARRGGHVALRFTAPGADVNALGQALVAAGVVVSTRQPDALRFGLHPLTTQHVELWEALQRLRAILDDGRWREARFQSASI